MEKFSYPGNLYPFQSKWMHIDGSRIHYIDEGIGEVILFCHPPVTSSFMYRNMIKILSTNFRCIALDFPGFGLSKAAENYTQSIFSQSAIIGKFIEQMKLEKIFLLMQEVGGHAALTAIIKKPAILKGIIITDTIIFPCSSYPRIYKMLSLVNVRVFIFINNHFNFLIRAMTRFGIRKRKLTSNERNTYKAMFNTKEKRKSSIHLLYEIVAQEELMNRIYRAFETIFNKIPALIIYGKKDPLTGLGIPQRIHKMLPNSELYWIEEEAHFPHEGAPEEMSSLITSWLQKASQCKTLF